MGELKGKIFCSDCDKVIGIIKSPTNIVCPGGCSDKAIEDLKERLDLTEYASSETKELREFLLYLESTLRASVPKKDMNEAVKLLRKKAKEIEQRMSNEDEDPN